MGRVLPAWAPYNRELWPGTKIGPDGRPSSPMWCQVHNCSEVVRREDGAFRCLLCETDERFFDQTGPITEGHAMRKRYERFLAGEFMPWAMRTQEGGG